LQFSPLLTQLREDLGAILDPVEPQDPASAPPAEERDQEPGHPRGAAQPEADARTGDPGNVGGQPSAPVPPGGAPDDRAGDPTAGPTDSIDLGNPVPTAPVPTEVEATKLLPSVLDPVTSPLGPVLSPVQTAVDGVETAVDGVETLLNDPLGVLDRP
jgi:hypothetical protein